VADSELGHRYHFTSDGTLTHTDLRLEAGLGYLRLDAAELGGGPVLLDAEGVPAGDGMFTLRVLGGGRIALVPAFSDPERPLAGLTVDARTGRVVGETIGVPGERGRLLGGYWRVDHDAGTAVRLDEDGSELTGPHDTAVVHPAPGGGITLASGADGRVMFQRPGPGEVMVPGRRGERDADPAEAGLLSGEGLDERLPEVWVSSEAGPDGSVRRSLVGDNWDQWFMYRLEALPESLAGTFPGGYTVVNQANGEALHFDADDQLRVVTRERLLTGEGLQAPWSELGVERIHIPATDTAQAVSEVRLTGDPGLVGSFSVAPLKGDAAARLPGGFAVTDTVTGETLLFDANDRFDSRLADGGSGSADSAPDGASGREQLSPQQGFRMPAAEFTPELEQMFRRTVEEGRGAGGGRAGAGRHADVSALIGGPMEVIHNGASIGQRDRDKRIPQDAAEVARMAEEIAAAFREFGLPEEVLGPEPARMRADAHRNLVEGARRAVDGHLGRQGPDGGPRPVPGEFAVRQIEGGGHMVVHERSGLRVEFGQDRTLVYQESLPARQPQGLKVGVRDTADPDAAEQRSYQLLGPEEAIADRAVGPAGSFGRRAEYVITDTDGTSVAYTLDGSPVGSRRSAPPPRETAPGKAVPGQAAGGDSGGDTGRDGDADSGRTAAEQQPEPSAAERDTAPRNAPAARPEQPARSGSGTPARPEPAQTGTPGTVPDDLRPFTRRFGKMSQERAKALWSRASEITSQYDWPSSMQIGSETAQPAPGSRYWATMHVARELDAHQDADPQTQDNRAAKVARDLAEERGIGARRGGLLGGAPGPAGSTAELSDILEVDWPQFISMREEAPSWRESLTRGWRSEWRSEPTISRWPLLGRRGSLVPTIYGVKSAAPTSSSGTRGWKSVLASLPGPMISNLISFGATAFAVQEGAKGIIRAWFPHLNEEVAEQYATLFAAAAAGAVYPITNTVGARLKALLGGQSFIPKEELTATQKRWIMAGVNVAGTVIFPIPHAAWGMAAEKGLIPPALDRFGWAIKGPLGTAAAVSLNQALESFLEKQGLYRKAENVPPGAIQEVMRDHEEIKTNVLISSFSQMLVTLASSNLEDLPRALKDTIGVWVYFACYLYPRGVEALPEEDSPEEEWVY
jgi:hypothetical protein